MVSFTYGGPNGATYGGEEGAVYNDTDGAFKPQTAFIGANPRAVSESFGESKPHTTFLGAVVTAENFATASYTPTLTASGDPVGADTVSPLIEWQLTRDGSSIEANLYDVELLDSANTFGDEAICKIDDVDGSKFDQYPRGTRVDIGVSVNGGITFIDKFSGYVVERREIEQAGADALEITAYTFDQFLRRNKVSTDLSGLSIADALESIITNDTPITHTASNIEVGDEQELTRSYRGDPVEQTLQDLAFKSNDENFGVNDSLEFFFRPRETKHIDRGIDDTQWFNTDIPERGKEAINEVEVWYNDGDESVIVDDGGDKLDLQNSLGLDDPGKQKAEITREELTDISDAEDEGRKYLNFRNNTLSGQITTFGLFNAQPGDTIDVTISTQGIDTEFQIAEVEYRWGTDETILTVVEKRGDNDDVLLRLTEAVNRVEMRPSNRDAPKNRITTTDAQAIVETTATDSVEGEISSDRFTNSGRNLIRDSWTGESIDPIDTLVVGDDASGLSRSNESLRNQTNSFAVSPSLAGSDGVEFTTTLDETIKELGLETSSGELVYRAVIPDGLNATDITISLTVTDDDSISRGVITNDGQTAVRDILADNSPITPDEYGYGSDSTDPVESDSSLGNEVVRESLEEVLIQSADTTSEWDNIVSDDLSNMPLTIQNSELALQQSSFTVEAEDFDTETGSSLGADEPEYSGDGNTTAIVYSTNDVSRTWEFDLDYTIPAGDFEIYHRNEGDSSNGSVPAVDWYLDNEFIGSTNQVLSLDWKTVYSSNSVNSPELSPGTHEIRAENALTGSGGSRSIDVIAPVDDRYTYTFDNDVSDSNGYLDGPELYPEQVVQSLDTASTRRNTDEARFSSSWNDTSNSQYVELANDGSTFTRFNNSNSGTATFSSEDAGIDSNIALSRFGSQSVTPRQGINGQAIDSWELFAGIVAVGTDGIGENLSRAIIPPGTTTGSVLSEGGLFGNNTLLTRSVFAEFSVGSDTRIASAETTRYTGEE